MAFIVGKDGKISVVRVGSLAVIVGLLLIVGAIISFLLDQQSRRQPLDVQPFPSAELYTERTTSPVSRSLTYRIPNDTVTIPPVPEGGTAPTAADIVARHYNERLSEFEANQSDPERCVRTPRAGNYATYEPNTGVLPFQWKCMFDNSGFNNSTQFTEITIYPGIITRSDDGTTYDNRDYVMVYYEQRWDR